MTFHDSPRQTQTQLQALDLFCGGGGLSLGFEHAEYEILAGIDANADYLQTFDENHDAPAVERDLASTTPSEILNAAGVDASDVDVIIGGPPCKGFSLAGERDPDDDRNQLVDRYLDAVEHIQPRAFAMENVPGLLSMEDGDVIDHILDRAEEAGYAVDYDILNAADYGVPQTRRRVFVIGVHKSLNIEPSFPEPTHDEDEYVTVEEAFSGVDWNAVSNHDKTNHRDDTVERIAEVDHGDSLYDSYADSWRRIYPDRPAPTVKENHNAPFIHPFEDRVGTVRECAVLQSFPTDFTFIGPKSKQLKVVGNAVPPRLGEVVGQSLRETLLAENPE